MLIIFAKNQNFHLRQASHSCSTLFLGKALTNPDVNHSLACIAITSCHGVNLSYHPLRHANTYLARCFLLTRKACLIVNDKTRHITPLSNSASKLLSFVALAVIMRNLFFVALLTETMRLF